MNKKTARRKRDLKTKLLAAVAMLLVSSLMMVTTTYAWFTLSTAPEVTGITTAVGANGNLEMALMNPKLQDPTTKALLADWGNKITSGTSDSMDAANQLIKDANITWGNLVDLSDNNTYGMHNIVLYPAQLNVTGNTLAANPLQRPVYGADGRVAQLKADTLTAGYASGIFAMEDQLGVRAVGTASSMTARELAHRAALSAAASASTSAKTAASTALNTYGNVLAGMAIKKTGGTTQFTYSEVNTLKTVVIALQTAHTHIETALKQYIVAHNIAPNSVNDSTYAAIQQEIEGLTLKEIMEDTDIEKPDNAADAYAALVASQGKVTSALSTLSTALEGKTETATDITWDSFQAALNAIMNYSSMKLNGMNMDAVVEKDEQGNYKNSSTLINAMGGKGLELQMPTGSGVLADIADFCGNYTASIIFPDGTAVAGVLIGGVKASMTTSSPKTPTWLKLTSDNTAPFADAASATETKSITEFYGYIVDLAFRTNANGSYLKLQQEGTDRIYGEEGNNDSTQGHGSTMTFAATDTFGVPKVTSLMENLRIVFFDPGTKAIIGYARLDANNAVIEGTSVTMKMGMWDEANKKFKTGDDATKIVDLAQNEAKAISMLVYLDGTTVTNADVAATGSTSMIGSMNLQFSSSAELVPMEYADLKEGQSSTNASQKIDMKAVSVSNTSTVAGITVSKAIGTNGTGFGVVFNGTIPEGATVVATVAGQEVTGAPQNVSGIQGYAFAYTEALTAETEVVITITAPAAGQTPEQGSDAT